MSDDRRKNARTQGRFSDSHKKEKAKQKNGAAKPKAQSSSSASSLQFQENSSQSFPDLNDKKKPVEIRESGFKALSGQDDTESRIYYDPSFISESMASEWMTELHSSIDWDDQDIVIHGQKVPQPRQIAWFGPFPYSYSGAILEAAEMPRLVRLIKDQVEQHMAANGFKDVCINSVLLNLYRNGKDSVAWHSDDELSMGVMPTIASVSLGEIRKFEMKPKKHVVSVDPELKYFVNLTPGSLLVMDGNMQTDWLHQVPKEFHDKGPRINLTFRTVYSKDEASRIASVPSKTKESVKEPVKTSHVPIILDEADFPSLSNNDISAIPTSDASETFPENIDDSQPESVESCDDDDVHQIARDDDAVHQPVQDDDVLHQPAQDSDDAHQAENDDLRQFSQDDDVVHQPAQDDGALRQRTQDGDHRHRAEEDDLRQLSEDGNHPADDGDSQSVNNCDVDILHQPVSDDVKSDNVKEMETTLNINAPAFVPQSSMTSNPYTNYQLGEFARIQVFRLDQSEMADLNQALVRYIRREQNCFAPRNWYELNTYLNLVECGLNDDALRIINERIVSLLKLELSSMYNSAPPKRYTPRDRRYR